MNYSAEQISSFLGIKPKLSLPKAKIMHVVTDSRTSVLENSLFFAIKGPRHDGHKYIPELIKKGVKNFVVEKKVNYNGVNIWLVKNSIGALQKIASAHRQEINSPVLAIAGSNGKTTVKEWLYELLWTDLHIVKSPKSYNSQIGVPLSVLNFEKTHALGLFEAGISRVGEMQYLQKILRPQYGIFTNIGPAHDEGFSSIKQKIQEKLRLFSGVKKLIYCSDYQDLDQEIKQQKIPALSWSFKNTKADLFISKKKNEGHSTLLEYFYQKQRFNLRLPFRDSASVENAIHCFAFMLFIEIPIEQIQTSILKLNPLPMRLEVKEGEHNTILINDTYNADLLSLKMALDFMEEQKQSLKHKTLIISDIRESKNETLLYQKINQLIDSHKINSIYSIGTHIQKQLHVSKKTEIYNFANTQQLLTRLQNKPLKNTVVLVKGAREFELEQVTRLLEKKIHETKLEVNLNALEHNLNYYKSMIDTNTKMMVMLKAFSYGHGSYEIAKTLEYNKIDYIGVAYTDEGVELRQKGIKTPIMVMNPETYQYDLMLKYGLEPVIYSTRILDELGVFLHQHSKAKIKAHIEVDTGMHRLGFDWNSTEILNHHVLLHTRLKIGSVFSHFASSENKLDDAFTDTQFKRYQTFIKVLQKKIKYPFIKHISNSSGIERFHNMNLDMVRLGIGLFGVSPDRKTQSYLLPVATLKTSISQLKWIKAGESIGYSTKNRVKKKTLIATLPIGYADGIHRVFGNGKAQFLVGSKLAPTIGNICMDTCMINVTHILDCKEGDDIVIFGEIPQINTLANQVGTISHELLTAVSSRVKRIYYNE